jgi:hypothetical protein
MTPTTCKSLCEFMEVSRRNRSRISNKQIHAHTKKTPHPIDPRRAILDGGPFLSGLGEDGPTVTTMVPPVSGKHDGTCKILSR